MDKATKLRIRALGLGFLCALVCILIVMATNWIVGFVAYFPIYHGSKIFCRKVLKTELPDEALIDSKTIIVSEMTPIEEVKSEKVKKRIKRISYAGAALPFIVWFGFNLYIFLRLGIWNHKVHWEAIIAPSIFCFIVSRIIAIFVTYKVLGIKILQTQDNAINHYNNGTYSTHESDSIMSTSDIMYPSNPLGFHGQYSCLNPNADD